MGSLNNQTLLLQGLELRSLIDRAMGELQEKSASLDALLILSEAAWSIDQDLGSITFTCQQGIHATAPVQMIGTYNPSDCTWLWAWDHPSILKPLRCAAQVVRNYGELHNIPLLTTRLISCHENDCWEFTALACLLNNAQAAYRGAAGGTFIFTVFENLCMSRNEAVTE